MEVKDREVTVGGQYKKVEDRVTDLEARVDLIHRALSYVLPGFEESLKEQDELRKEYFDDPFESE